MVVPTSGPARGDEIGGGEQLAAGRAAIPGAPVFPARSRDRRSVAIVRLGPGGYGMDAAFMSLEQRGSGIHVV